MRRVGIVDIPCQSKGYAISLSRLISKSTMSAIDFSDSCRTHHASVDRGARSKPIDPRPSPYKVTLDRGLQLRIAPDGKRTLLVRYTVKGSNTERQYRLPQEYGDAPGQLKLAAACAEAGRIRALARQGVDWTVAEDTRLEAEASTRAAAALQRRAGPRSVGRTELRDYVEKKRRVKDGLPLKARTKSDYLECAMQILRAVLRWNGVLAKLPSECIHSLGLMTSLSRVGFLRKSDHSEATYWCRGCIAPASCHTDTEICIICG